jgi:class 3 adenylate cyclase/tetratricopeptide (TPR) repeat protein
VPIGPHRKVVTVVFCDVVGSTKLGESVDPEALQALLARYFERMQGIVVAHGGSVEKFIGDAVMAVFGVPVTHEDDAVRACRAALEMRDALPGLGVAGRIGVNSGEVLVGTTERLATGDAVNIAARLEQAADPGEVLVGSATIALAGARLDVGEERLLELKGKRAPVAAHVLHSVGDVVERPHDSPFVGRDEELGQLVEAWRRVLADGNCELVTVVGEPVVGKSRLVAEVLAELQAPVVRGRCLPYGEGATYWPVVEVVKQLDALPTDASAANAIRSLLGESSSVSTTDEIAWAFRKLLEELAPLVVVFDDVQWGADTFLDLVESTALLSSGAPLMLLSTARPELLDRRPSWPTRLRLQPLRQESASRLVDPSLPEDVRLRILDAAGGNPLFLTEMVALSEGGSDVTVPPTLRALLAARLDQLDERERTVLERGSVEGELFHRGALRALDPDEAEVTPRLTALVRRHLIRPDKPQLAGEEAYRFCHLLIRDTAYEALPKSSRATLHRRFAEWLERQEARLVELDEIVGYHLEQAARYLDELGRPEPEVALAAGDRLALAGRRMLWRGDNSGAFRLLERSLALTRPYRAEIHRELDLALAVAFEPRRAAAIATAARDAAEAAGEDDLASVAEAAAAGYRLYYGEASAADVERSCQAARRRLEAVDDHYGLITVWRTLGDVANFRGCSEDRVEATEEALRHSERAGVPPLHLAELASALVNGPRPASEALELLERFPVEHPGPLVTLHIAQLMAMLGRIDEARALAEAARDRMREFGYGKEANLWFGEIAAFAGEDEVAAGHYRAYCDFLENSGRTAELSTYAPQLGHLLCSLGDYDEAETLAEKGRELGDPDDIATQIWWRVTTALVASARGRAVEAEQLAEEAVAIAAPIDHLQIRAAALCALGEVLDASGRRDEALEAWHGALACFDQKQLTGPAARLRERLQQHDRRSAVDARSSG